jgi:hypothetical protein
MLAPRWEKLGTVLYLLRVVTRSLPKAVVIAWVETSSVILNMPEPMGLFRNTNEL